MSRTIVIIDDDPIIRLDIREMLEEEHYTVVGEGKNGQEAIELAAKLKPDLVIMDVKMPVMNGIKAAMIIRGMQHSSVLLLTAYSQKELVQQARDAGVVAYLVKPVSEADLIPAVEIALSQKAALDGLKQDIRQLQQTLEERKLIERAKGIVMKRHGLDEPAAYQHIQAHSMTERVPLSELAVRIIERDGYA
ncbi:ANTAR domain-containing response regulator [Paenibacillus sp. CF384]|uniref:ANTAR domain-containing response regulator n=1 Tax=Paenibacillus sp. CF384 TaxID=1884382 RepID=UPI00089512AF|nr:response regulator [Paenibacillus sp. CF384]SDX08711.1 response regulator receiver and ANTAR domain protein [Paenibacillus sp. CF384]